VGFEGSVTIINPKYLNSHPCPERAPIGLRKTKKEPEICPDYKSPHKIVILANRRFYRSPKAG
jgi:hypothetical protein